MPTLDDTLKEYKKMQVVYNAAELGDIKIERIPTGIFTFDLLSNGGIPEGRTSGFYGAHKSTKSTTGYRVINNFLKKYPKKKAMIVEFENTYDEGWAGNFIEDMNRLVVVYPDHAEQGIDIMKAGGMSEELGFIMVDSIPAMVPIAHQSKSAIEPSQPGDIARAVRSMLMTISPLQQTRRKVKNYLTLLLINQMRANISGMRWAPKTKKPGGYVLDYVYSLEAKFFKARKFYTRMKLPAIAQHEFTIEKNKFGLDGRSGEFSFCRINYDGNTKPGSLVQEDVIATYAQRAGVLIYDGSKWILGDHTYKNKKELITTLENDKELMEDFQRLTLDACLQDIVLSVGKETGGDK